MTHSTPASHPDADTWLDFLHGLLEPAEQERVLGHLETCGTCEDEFRRTAASHARGRAAVSRLGAAAPPPRALKTRGTMRRFPAWRLTAAAAILALAVGIPVSRRTSERAAPVLEPAPKLPAPKLRGAIRGLVSTAADSGVVRGIEAYNQGDLARARELLLPDTDGLMEPARRLYLGTVLLELGDATGARDVLQTLDYERIPEPWKSESRWTLARALGNAGNRTASDSLLRVLASEEGEVAERARRALRPAGAPW